tara:strand:+ start:25456 stop:27408 length:1953 start_codon:yes stop_codon:yes gene_type:complete
MAMQLRLNGIKLLFLLTFLSLFFVVESYAQGQGDEIPKMRIVKVEPAPSSQIIRSSDIDNYDDNGELGAGLIIQSDISDLTIQASNGIIKQDRVANEWRVLVSPTERLLTILSLEFVEPLEIILRDEGVELESGKFWIIQVTGDKATVDQSVIFNIDPTEAVLKIDNGEPIQVTNGSHATQLSIGTHTLSIERAGYETRFDTVDVSSTNWNFQYTLSRLVRVEMSISSNPVGAIVYINDQPAAEGETPFRKYYFPGEYVVRLIKPGFVDLTRTVQLSSTNNTFQFNLPENSGFMNIETIPTDAVVTLDGQVFQETSNVSVQPGNYLLSITKQGFRPYEETVNITLRDTLQKNIELEMIKGSIYVSTRPNDADLELYRNGVRVQGWTKNLADKTLPVGNYELRARAINHDSYSESFTLSENEERVFTINLVQTSGIGSLTVKSVFSEAEFNLKGISSNNRLNMDFSQSPIDVQSLNYGNYILSVKKRGFKVVEKEISIRNSNTDIVLLEEFIPKSKGKAFFRSLFIPGSGHGYLGKKGAGFLYFVGSAAAAGFTIKSYLDYQSDYEAYTIAKSNYDNATSNFTNAFNEYETALKTAQESKNGIILGATVLAVVKGLETFSIFVQRSPKRELKRAKVGFNPTISGISMNIDF